MALAVCRSREESRRKRTVSTRAIKGALSKKRCSELPVRGIPGPLLDCRCRRPGIPACLGVPGIGSIGAQAFLLAEGRVACSPAWLLSSDLSQMNGFWGLGFDSSG